MPAFSDTIDSSRIKDRIIADSIPADTGVQVEVAEQTQKSNKEPPKSSNEQTNNGPWYWPDNLFGSIWLVILAILGYIAQGLIRKWIGSKRPFKGINWLINPIPKGDPKKFTVAIAQLDRDTDNLLQQNLIDGLADLPFKDSLEIIAIPRVVTSRKSNETSRQNAERKLASRYLKKSKADILVWGIALGEDYDQAKLSWHATGNEGLSNRYQLGELLELPELFVDDLKDALIIVVLTQLSGINNEESTGKFIADQLEQVLAKLERLVNKFESSMNEVPTGFLFVLGNALSTIGKQQGKNSALERAIDLFRELLKVTAQKQAPLDWAMTQNNLGVALQILGERESGIQRLEEAVRAYQEALKEYARERVPLDWAMTQNNLGIALQSLGERESGIQRLEEAVRAFQEALKERTRERVPLFWAMTQNNLGTALARLGERESGTQKLNEAVRAFQEALKEYTRERVPLSWAMTQNNLGSALRILGERESGTLRLEDAANAYEYALTVFTPEESSYYWSLTKENLENVRKLINERK